MRGHGGQGVVRRNPRTRADQLTMTERRQGLAEAGIARHSGRRTDRIVIPGGGPFSDGVVRGSPLDKPSDDAQQTRQCGRGHPLAPAEWTLGTQGGILGIAQLSPGRAVKWSCDRLRWSCVQW
jgi:hypothetical protein